MQFSNPQTAPDAVVVLGARVLEDGRPSRRLEARITAGIAALLAFQARFLLLTGGPLHGERAEALVMRDLALAAGIEGERILIEPAARTTFENAAHSIALLRRRGLSRVVLVADRLHLPRAVLAFRALGLAVCPHAAPWQPERRSAATWLYAVLYEAAALPWYGLQIAAGRHRRLLARAEASVPLLTKDSQRA